MIGPEIFQIDLLEDEKIGSKDGNSTWIELNFFGHPVVFKPPRTSDGELINRKS